MNKHPDLKFIVDPKKDIEVYLGFWETGKYYKEVQKDMNRFFYNLYPELNYLKNKENDNKAKQRKGVRTFVETFYSQNTDKLENGIKTSNKQWAKEKDKFFKLTDRIFKNTKWPNGGYLAYVTIWGTFPRFLEDKTFCFPYKYKDKKFVLAVSLHEMLHFMFYEYAIKKHSNLFGKLETEQGIFWEIAEIFNSVMHKTELEKIHGEISDLTYPHHKKILPHFVKLWHESRDIDEWIIKSFEYFKN